MMIKPHIFNFFWIMTLLFLVSCSTLPSTRFYERQSSASFEDTLLSVDVAISEYNYRIIHRSDIGKAIRERGDKTFPLSTIINFCNITYAKQMMEIDPQLINDMPCNIAVRQTDDHKVIVSTRLMNEQVNNHDEAVLAKKINHNLIGIINSTVE